MRVDDGHRGHPFLVWCAGPSVVLVHLLSAHLDGSTGGCHSTNMPLRL